ncbi:MULTISPECIES: TRAP transporter small permease [Halocynthiibacter]|uniref:TRAP transporter small permease protein n=1 Tax=Halocynthiibacter halioticoli TaxID=2986804 RepID=A0AAE3LU59_9RHOB|nr:MULTISPECIES: TRAP transporter small permease [Halocynthiibacter]MCV6822930.1 TRAP transporter small permease [Halocynthiibacter halioticoli]MCW4055931.1 TRAP transporter small permease [Halocynthiibacter sp. SDUM655004]
MTSQITPAPVTKLLSIWHLAEKWIAVVAFTMIGVLIFLDVAGREFVGPVGTALGFEMGSTGLYGAGKMSLFLLVIGAFAGLGVSVATGTQIVPRIAFSWVPASWGANIDRLANLISGAVFAAVTYYGWVFVASSKSIGTVMPGLETPVWIIQCAIPIGFASAAVRYFIFAIWPASAPAREEAVE